MRKSVAKSNKASLELKHYIDVQYYYVGALVCYFPRKVITYFKKFCRFSCLPFTGRNEGVNTNIPQRKLIRPILVPARSRCFYDRAPTQFLGSNPTRGMVVGYCDVCCQVEEVSATSRSLVQRSHAKVCVCVCVTECFQVQQYNSTPKMSR